MEYEAITHFPDEETTVDMRERKPSCNIPITKIDKILQEKFKELTDADAYQAKAIIKEISETINNFLEQETFPGDADDWHNFAVGIARSDLYDLCCDVIEKGLEKFPKNTDLLADYLQYGVCCGRIDKCKAFYKILAKIPRIRYTWRAYSFSVNWLQYLWERSDSEKEMEKLQNEMFALAASFRQNIPETEESYRCEADIFKLLHKRTEEERTLRQALSELAIAPKCALRLADMLFDRGSYTDALEQIERGLADANQTQESVSNGYLYCLKGLAKIAVTMREKQNFDKETTQEIYEAFDMALQLERQASYRQTIEKKTKIVISQSRIDVDDTDYKELAYLVH